MAIEVSLQFIEPFDAMVPFLETGQACENGIGLFWQLNDGTPS